MQMRDNILLLVKLIIEWNTGIDLAKIGEDDNLVDLGCDSLDIEDIIIDLEKHLPVIIPEYQSKKMKRVRDIVDYLNDNVEGKAIERALKSYV